MKGVPARRDLLLPPLYALVANWAIPGFLLVMLLRRLICLLLVGLWWDQLQLPLAVDPP
jgi:hypothetical protein